MARTSGEPGRLAATGTRGGLGRLAGMVIGLAALICLSATGTARGGTYAVAQCGWGIGTELDPALPRTEGTAAYLRPGFCNAPSGTPGLAFEMGYANDGDQGVARARWAAPPGTSFVGARFVWSGELAPGVFQVAGIADENGFEGIAIEVVSTPPHLVATGFGAPAPSFEVRLECVLLGAQWGCTRSRRSSAVLSGLTLTVDDRVPPQAGLGGELAAPGWRRGKVGLEIAGEDPVGAGVYGLAATVDGATVLSAPAACAVATIEGEVRATRLQPCPAKASGAGEVDTTALADGAHTLRGCAVDFGGGAGCAAEVQIQVDNSPPEVEFAAAPEGQVAATVSDAFSGPAGGTIAVRRADSETWSDLPTTLERGGAGTATLRAQLPDLGGGAFFFRATATDGAGNSGAAQFRASGSPADVRRQVAGAGQGSGPARRGGTDGVRGRGTATHLVAYLVRSIGGARTDRALARRDARRIADGGTRLPGTAGSPLTVDYGSGVEVRGRLTDAHRGGVPRQHVVIVARAAGGAGTAPERRRVITDRTGRFGLRLSPGTSRRVVVSFHGGGSFAPAPRRSLALRVRAAVSLAATPLRLHTGESVTLSGRVRPGPARIPARGKLVTIQYLERASGRWRPALVVRTGARGRFHARYRFRYITGEARIRLRATALPEARWPYAAGSSGPVTVMVDG